MPSQSTAPEPAATVPVHRELIDSLTRRIRLYDGRPGGPAFIPSIIDAARALVDAAERPEPPWGRCTTPGCDGDARYAAPGRRHIAGCRYPLDSPVPVSDEAEAAYQQWSDENGSLSRKEMWKAGFRAARLAGKDDER